MEIKQMMAQLLLAGLRCSSQGNSAQRTSLQLTESGTNSVTPHRAGKRTGKGDTCWVGHGTNHFREKLCPIKKISLGWNIL